MKTAAIFAAFAASLPLLVVGAPVPKDEGNYVIVYETSMTTVTIDVTVTVYPGQPTAAAHALYDDQPGSTSSDLTTSIPSSTLLRIPSTLSSVSVQLPSPTPTSVFTPPPPPTSASPAAVTHAPAQITPPAVAAPAPVAPVAPVAPAPVAPAPAPPVPAPPPVAPAQLSETAPSGGAGSGRQFANGDLTYYDVGLGSCGVTSTSTQHVVAISHELFDQYTPNGNPNKNPLCGKTINISYGGGSYPATIVDRCTGCKMSDLDLSPDFFKVVAPHGDGRVSGCSWSIQ